MFTAISKGRSRQSSGVVPYIRTTYSLQAVEPT